MARRERGLKQSRAEGESADFDQDEESLKALFDIRGRGVFKHKPDNSLY